MFLQTDALCLRVVPFSRTSHIVSWLTPRHGLLRTVVKGACRPKSWFLGQYDLFQTCDIVLYAKSRNGLHVLKECCVADSRARFRSDWRAAGISSYLCDLVSRNLFGNAKLPGCFDLLSRTFDALLSNQEVLPLMFWFELRLAHALGLSPSLTRCTSCGRSLRVQPAYSFSVSQGGIVCPACPVREAAESLRLSPDLVSILRRWQETETPRAAMTTRCSDKQLLAISNLLDRFAAYHLEIRPSGRRAAITLSALKSPAGVME